jgi:hypothetical protein
MCGVKSQVASKRNITTYIHSKEQTQHKCPKIKQQKINTRTKYKASSLSTAPYQKHMSVSVKVY